MASECRKIATLNKIVALITSAASPVSGRETVQNLGGEQSRYLTATVRMLLFLRSAANPTRSMATSPPGLGR